MNETQLKETIKEIKDAISKDKAHKLAVKAESIALKDFYEKTQPFEDALGAIREPEEKKFNKIVRLTWEAYENWRKPTVDISEFSKEELISELEKRKEIK